MIRTGKEYKDSLTDGREVWIDGELVEDVTTHPAFKPIVDVRARIYDMARDPATAATMTYADDDTGEICAIGGKPPRIKQDWHAKHAAVETVLDDVGGVVTRVGDETVGEMWSLYDGQDVLNEIDPSFSENIRQHVRRAALLDPFHVSANTDPKGDRSRHPRDQDPDVLLHVVRETDNGIVVRGAKFETAAAYANQAFVKPTIGDWGNDALSEYAVGFVADMGAPRIRHICRSGFAGRMPVADYPLSNRVDEIDTMIVFDDVEIPWENVFFYRHTRAAAFIRATLHRYSMYAFVHRHLRLADLMLGVAYANSKQTGVTMHQGVREKLAQLACYREGIAAHLAASIEMAQVSPGGLLMPNQALLYTGRVHACSRLPDMMHLVRDICGCQISLVPSAAAFGTEGPGEWLAKFFRVGDIEAEDRRKLLVYARDLLNSDHAGHRLTFQLFAQSTPFSHLLAVYNNYDFGPAVQRMAKSAGIDDPLGMHGMSESIIVGGHRRIRPFNTADTYPEQRISNDLCQAVVAGNTIYLRGQVAQDLRTRESVAIGDPAGQARKVMDNIELLLGEAGAGLEHIVTCDVYLTDVRHRESVYRVLGERMRGVYPCFTGVVVQALARPEWLVEVTAIAVKP